MSARLGRPAVWLAQARNDLAHARHSAGGTFYAQACYSAQQAAEKALKGLLLHACGDLSRTHSIVGLLRELAAAGVAVPEDVLSPIEAQDLTRLNIATRYPLGDAEDAPAVLFGAAHAEAATAAAERIMRFVERLLLAPPE